MRARWQDPAFRERQAAAVRANWQDPAFRERQAAATRAELAERWQDPAFRERHAAAVRANWQDPAFRERHAAATRARFGSLDQLNEEGCAHYALFRAEGFGHTDALDLALDAMRQDGVA